MVKSKKTAGKAERHTKTKSVCRIDRGSRASKPTYTTAPEASVDISAITTGTTCSGSALGTHVAYHPSRKRSRTRGKPLQRLVLTICRRTRRSASSTVLHPKSTPSVLPNGASVGFESRGRQTTPRVTLQPFAVDTSPSTVLSVGKQGAHLVHAKTCCYGFIHAQHRNCTVYPMMVVFTILHE